MSSSLRKLAKKSQFQLKVLNLYAQYVRLAKQRPGLLEKARVEFKEGARLNPREDSLLIDYKLRRAKHTLDMLKANQVKQVKIFTLNNTKSNQ